jgi:GT2 family glycosyltransferase
VTIVYVVFNKRDKLRTSLTKMLREPAYDGALDAIVVDNASTDGSAAMVREEFPEVELIERDENIGAPAWNEGYARARGDWVLTLDDDAYLPPGGLDRALAAAERTAADLVSFRVVSTVDPDWVFTEGYKTGLFSFWGCAWLVRGPVLRELGGYDPQLFMWANELEFALRFFDGGHRHLHLANVDAMHMKEAPPVQQDEHGYMINARHFAYVAGKLLRPRDAFEALVALLVRNLRDGVRDDRMALRALPVTLAGFAKGIRHRSAVANRELSRTYRHNFETFASPWWLSRPLGELLGAAPRELTRRARYGERRPEGIGRRDQFFAERPQFYPREPAVLDFGRGAASVERVAA